MELQNLRSRKSPRLKCWDYSNPHWYFVTICTQNHSSYFGRIIDGEMLLNKFGNVAKNLWKEIPNHYQIVELDYFVVMPNHIHGIIIINSAENDSVGTCHGMSLQNKDREFGKPVKNSLSMIINHYKGSVTKWENKNGFTDFKWQRSFYDRIIRNENELHQIQKYIEQNPLKWDYEKNTTENLEI